MIPIWIKNKRGGYSIIPYEQMYKSRVKIPGHNEQVWMIVTPPISGEMARIISENPKYFLETHSYCWLFTGKKWKWWVRAAYNHPEIVTYAVMSLLFTGISLSALSLARFIYSLLV